MKTSITKLPVFLSWFTDVNTLCRSLSVAVSDCTISRNHFHSLIEAKRTHLVVVGDWGISYLAIDPDGLDQQRLRLVSHMRVTGHGSPLFDRMGMPLRGLALEEYWADRGPVLTLDPNKRKSS